ncbi:MAG: phage holin [Clostridia bacterium]|nr:phage holin [Clostridia bacterium]
MKINWKVRVKNPYFWIGIVGVILSAMGLEPQMLTSWQALGNALLEFIKNPFLIGTVIVAVIGVIVDPTTKGMEDSERAMQYQKPCE